jgi:NADH-quinone oxidoreductase subunit L
MMVVAVIGTATALMAGSIGLVQNDIKRVLAYSTVSQLGYMFLAMGVGAFGAGIFHLYTHAFFKACLFLASGAVIHALHGEQDVRNMGGLKAGLPLTYWTFLIASLAIAGVPGFAGFFSKDEILFETFAHGHTILWIVGILTSLLTATYMFRLVFLTFHGVRRHDAPAPMHPEEEEPAVQAVDSGHTPSAMAAGAHDTHAETHGRGHLHDAPAAMALVLVILASGSAVAGYIGIPEALGGHHALGTWLAPSFVARSVTTLAEGQVGEAGAAAGEAAGEASGGLELSLMIVSSVVAIAGIALAAFVWLKRRELADKAAAAFPGLYRLLLNKYYVDEVYDATIVEPIRIVSQEGLWRGIDVNIIDGAVNGTASIVDGGSSLLRRLQSGSVRGYAGSLFLGVVLILGYYLWR